MKQDDSKYLLLAILAAFIIAAAFLWFIDEKTHQPPGQIVTDTDAEALTLAKPLLKEFEGFRECAYEDAGGYSVGYGHHGVDIGDCVTLDQAEAYLDQDMLNSLKAVTDLVTVPLTVGQKAALISFTFAGRGKLARSDLLKLLNGGDYESAGSEINLWVYADMDGDGKKEKLAGLIRRRAAEFNLWNFP